MQRKGEENMIAMSGKRKRLTDLKLKNEDNIYIHKNNWLLNQDLTVM